MADTNDELTAEEKEGDTADGAIEPTAGAVETEASAEGGNRAKQPNRLLFDIGWGLGRMVRTLENGVTWLGHSSGSAVAACAKAISGEPGRRSKTKPSSTETATEGGIEMDMDVEGISATTNGAAEIIGTESEAAADTEKETAPQEETEQETPKSGAKAKKK